MISICLNLSFLEVKKITNHHASSLCLTQLDSISLSQKVDLHSLLDLICPSMINKIIFSSMFICLIVHLIRLTCKPSLKKYSLWSNCMEHKRNVVWTTTKLKYKEIWISYLKYFKISLQISNFLWILKRAEFQCLYTKLNLNKTVKPKLNMNFSLPWTPHGEKANENHQILLPRNATSLNFPHVSYSWR